MQAAATAVSFSVLPVKGSLQVQRRMAHVPARARRGPSGRVCLAAAAVEPAEVDYSSSTSVFPVEACDVIGGEACNAQMYPEAKIAASKQNPSREAVQEDVERDYLSYDEPKTVFPGEACDDLGGEFCEAPYQDGVSQELPVGSRVRSV